MLLWLVSILAFAGGIGLAGTMAWLEKKPRDDLMPSMIPTTPVMFIGLIIALLAAAHMLSLAGVSLPQR